MIRLFNYHYSRVYSYFSKGDAAPVFSTFAFILVFGFFNILTLVDIIVSVGAGVKITMPTFEGFKRIYLMLVILAIYSVFHYIFVSKKKHINILKEAQGETSKQFIVRYYVLLYVVSTIAFFVLSLWLRQVIRGF